MDTFAAMALATEEPTEALLLQKPYSRNQSIFTPVMWRNIICQSIFQFVLFNFFLFSIRFFPTDTYDFINRAQSSDDCAWFEQMQAKYPHKANNGKFYSEIYQCNYIINDMEPLEFTYQLNGVEQTIPADDRLTGNADVLRNPGLCRHYAFLFNLYVFLQIFNEINAKKLLPSEVNVLAGLFNNWYFITILLLSFGVQIALVQISGVAHIMKMKTLTFGQLMLTVAIGASSIVWGFIIRLLPLRWFGNLKIQEEPQTDEQESRSIKATLRKSRRQNTRQLSRTTKEFNES